MGQLVDEPAQPPGPVVVVDQRRRVDAFLPPEHVLDREQHDIGAGRVEQLQDRVARRVVERRPGIGVRRSIVIDSDERLALVHRGIVPPLGGWFRVVRAACGDAAGRIGARVLERLPVRVPVALPAQHLVAGNLQAVQRLADKRRDHAEILGDDLRAWRAQHVEHRFPLDDLIGLARRHKRGLAVGATDVGTEEADEVVDAVAVVELGAAPRARRKPLVVARRDLGPAVCRESPVLSRVRKGVWRRADRGVQPELGLAGPDVGAVAAHHEREVAEHPDVARVPRLPPLVGGEPLQVRMKQDLGREFRARGLERGRVAVAQRRAPLLPIPPVRPRVQRPEEGIVGEPPLGAVDEGLQPQRAVAVCFPLVLAEMIETGAKREELHGTNGGVIDRRGRARPP